MTEEQGQTIIGILLAILMMLSILVGRVIFG